MAKVIKTKPISIKEANEFVNNYHRHHRPTVRNCGRWALAAVGLDGQIVGVVITSNPVSATYMDGLTLEVVRLCVIEAAPKGTCSFLLSLCCSIWKKMGGERVITYTLSSESGESLRGAGWSLVGEVKPHRRWQNKSKADGIERDSLENYSLLKFRWEKRLRG